MRLSILTASVVFGVSPGVWPSQGHAQAVPGEATKVIAGIRSAALARNYANLRAAMIPEFTWSFGGDGNADQAIAEWKTKSIYLKQLARVTGAKCGFRTATVIQCPAKSGNGFRAGFEVSDGSWRMIYFVAGE